MQDPADIFVRNVTNAARLVWAVKEMGTQHMELTTVYDCMGSNLGKFPIPPGVLLAGYVTGTNGVPWTPAQYAAHPSALRIDQAPVNTAADETADLLDVEAGAATIADIPAWVKAAQLNYRAGARPGQRWPAAYLEESELTPAANALDAAGLTGNVNLFLTKPMTRQDAAAMLTGTGGPFPFVGIQYEFHDLYDVSLVSTAWLNAVSRKPPVTPPDTRYTVQVERYQDGFGWVLDTHYLTPPATRYRARVNNGHWSQWTEFRP